MLLHMLRERGQASVPGYQRRPIAALVSIDGPGPPTFVTNPDPVGKRGALLLVPSLKRSSAARPLLFADGPDYLFGIPDEGSDSKRAVTRRDLHLELAQRCVEETGNSLAQGAVTFLERVRDDAALAATIADAVRANPGDLTLRIDGRLVTDEPDVRRFWAASLGLGAPTGTGSARCVVCGEVAPIPPIWPVAIKGGAIPGGQSSGVQLVSMNSEVYESYGQTRATGAMTCGPCAERIVNGLNRDLAADSESHLRIGNVVYVFWTDTEQDFASIDFLNTADPAEVRELLRSPLTARTSRLKATEGHLFAVALSANASRAVVRDWVEVTIPEARRNLTAYFEAQSICGLYGEDPEPVRLISLAAATVRELRDLRPNPITQLLNAALRRHPLPWDLMAAAVRRAMVEDAPKVSRPQAALIKLTLSLQSEEVAVPAHLDTTVSQPAYRCGRLLAEIDSIQRDALGKLNATVVDRYFGAASTRPATVFGLLLKNSQNHLGKLRDIKPGAANAHDERLAEVMDGLEDFPGTLTLREQGWFCLGFYHQRAAGRRAIQEHMRNSNRPDEAIPEHEEAL